MERDVFEKPAGIMASVYLSETAYIFPPVETCPFGRSSAGAAGAAGAEGTSEAADDAGACDAADEAGV